ncbi:MAG: hypothetical protein AAGB34_11155, partial [Planctomycetota bacterium]
MKDMLYLSCAFDSSSRLRILFQNGVLVCTTMLVFSACNDRDIQEHVVAKGVEQVPEAVDAEEPLDEAAGDEVSEPWVVPIGWLRDPEPRPMRLATYRIVKDDTEVEVAITRFPGRVGGDLANVNRWRNQMGLGPIDRDVLAKSLERFSSEGFDGYEIRIESDSNVMLASGVYEVAHDRTWFVR